MPDSKLTSSIAIIGAGDVGATIAYSLILSSTTSEILLVDPQEDLRDAQIQDLADAAAHTNTPTAIRAGTPAEAGQCDIIVFAAGAKQKEGESRTDLLSRNKSILESSLHDMRPFGAHTVLLLVANPVDTLTQLAQRASGLPTPRVFGTGTTLDSARLRSTLASRARVATSAVHGWVLGEHGSSQVVAWSGVRIGGAALEAALPSGVSVDKEAVAADVRDTAARVIAGKGSTNFGIGAVAAGLCGSVLRDEGVVRVVSWWHAELGVCLSSPAVVGRGGVVRGVDGGFSEEEREGLEESAKALRGVLEELEKEEGEGKGENEKNEEKEKNEKGEEKS
ncbi:lactate dehydrogenase/glycoside hydrolase [Boeremia exigua]|uniref:lactate dehydrogenase/glycoside hydrolase n=1 Tax=Boeremia exigua TaxID=749465 RepID=UPI001E8DC127|nr:lactate dehydrogenase/glycoside hydrolase [Boeremia exigua]KAH6625525.1 lactate dehydrogenase/glycoside hydrolase [Boeremia exigua]